MADRANREHLPRQIAGVIKLIRVVFLGSARLLLTTSRELIAASAMVVLAVVVVPATVLALVRWWRSRRLDRMFAALPYAVRNRLLRQPSLLMQQNTFRHISYLYCQFGVAKTESAGTQLNRCTALRDALRKSILAAGGTLDFQSAQSVGAYWNAPLRDAEHAAHACTAALRIIDLVTAANRFPMLPGSESSQTSIAIGLASAEAAVGFCGASYLVEGDAPRLAAQLAQLCQHTGFSVLTGKDTQTAAGSSFAFLPVRKNARDAAAAPLYALLGGAMLHGSPQFRALETFQARIFAAIDRSDWASAKQLTAQARKLSGANASYFDRLAAQVEDAAARAVISAPSRRAA